MQYDIKVLGLRPEERRLKLSQPAFDMHIKVFTMIDLGAVRQSTVLSRPAFEGGAPSGVAIVLILLTSLATGQDVVGKVQNSSAPPQPQEAIFQMPFLFVEGGLNVNGDGYQPLSPDIGTGIDFEGRNLSVEIEGTYDFVRKTNDNNQVQNERAASGKRTYRFSTNFITVLPGFS